MKLGYTWYPKDFISDPEIMMMCPAQRGVYRDLIDLAYMNDNKIKYSIDQLCKYTGADEQLLQTVLNMKAKKEDGYWVIPSCDQRIKLAQKSRENGKKGGRPKTKNKPKINPEQNPDKTQDERQRKRKRESKSKSELYAQEFIEKIIENFDMYGGSEQEAKRFHDYYQKKDWIDNGGFDIRLNLDRKVQNWIKTDLRKKQQHESSRRIPLFTPRPNRKNG